MNDYYHSRDKFASHGGRRGRRFRRRKRRGRFLPMDALIPKRPRGQTRKIAVKTFLKRRHRLRLAKRWNGKLTI